MEMTDLTDLPDPTYVPQASKAQSELSYDPQKRVRVFVLSRYGYDQYSKVFGALPRKSFSVGLAPSVPAGGQMTSNVFSLIGMGLSDIGSVKSVAVEIERWVDRKKCRRIKFTKGDFHFVIDADTRADDIVQVFEEFRRLRNETEGGEVIQVIDD